MEVNFGGLLSNAFRLFREDVRRNRGNIKMLCALLSYRLAHVASRHRKIARLASLYAVPVIVLHRFLTEWLFGMDLPAATHIGAGLIIDHGYSLVINKHVVIGNNCRLRHCVTIGCKTQEDGSQGPSPRIGDWVDIGAGAILIGDICIGERAVIGAGAVVVRDVPAGATVVGNPSRVVRSISAYHNESEVDSCASST